MSAAGNATSSCSTLGCAATTANNNSWVTGSRSRLTSAGLQCAHDHRCAPPRVWCARHAHEALPPSGGEQLLQQFLVLLRLRGLPEDIHRTLRTYLMPFPEGYFFLPSLTVRAEKLTFTVVKLTDPDKQRFTICDRSVDRIIYNGIQTARQQAFNEIDGFRSGQTAGPRITAAYISSFLPGGFEVAAVLFPRVSDYAISAWLALTLPQLFCASPGSTVTVSSSEGGSRSFAQSAVSPRSGWSMTPSSLLQDKFPGVRKLVESVTLAGYPHDVGAPSRSTSAVRRALVLQYTKRNECLPKVVVGIRLAAAGFECVWKGGSDRRRHRMVAHRGTVARVTSWLRRRMLGYRQQVHPGHDDHTSDTFEIACYGRLGSKNAIFFRGMPAPFIIANQLERGGGYRNKWCVLMHLVLLSRLSAPRLEVVEPGGEALAAPVESSSSSEEE